MKNRIFLYFLYILILSILFSGCADKKIPVIKISPPIKPVEIEKNTTVTISENKKVEENTSLYDISRIKFYKFSNRINFSNFLVTQFQKEKFVNFREIKPFLEDLRKILDQENSKNLKRLEFAKSEIPRTFNIFVKYKTELDVNNLRIQTLIEQLKKKERLFLKDFKLEIINNRKIINEELEKIYADINSFQIKRYYYYEINDTNLSTDAILKDLGPQIYYYFAKELKLLTMNFAQNILIQDNKKVLKNDISYSFTGVKPNIKKYISTTLNSNNTRNLIFIFEVDNATNDLQKISKKMIYNRKHKLIEVTDSTKLDFLDNINNNVLVNKFKVMLGSHRKLEHYGFSLDAENSLVTITRNIKSIKELEKSYKIEFNSSVAEIKRELNRRKELIAKFIKAQSIYNEKVQAYKKLRATTPKYEIYEISSFVKNSLNDTIKDIAFKIYSKYLQPVQNQIKEFALNYQNSFIEINEHTITPQLSVYFILKTFNQIDLKEAKLDYKFNTKFDEEYVKNFQIQTKIANLLKDYQILKSGERRCQELRAESEKAISEKLYSLVAVSFKVYSEFHKIEQKDKKTIFHKLQILEKDNKLYMQNSENKWQVKNCSELFFK